MIFPVLSSRTLIICCLGTFMLQVGSGLKLLPPHMSEHPSGWADEKDVDGGECEVVCNPIAEKMVEKWYLGGCQKAGEDEEDSEFPDIFLTAAGAIRHSS